MSFLEQTTPPDYLPLVDIVAGLKQCVERFLKLDPNDGRKIYHLLQRLQICIGEPATAGFEESFHELERALNSGTAEMIARAKSEAIIELGLLSSRR